MYLFLVKIDGQWTATTRRGHLMVCSEDQLMTDSPRIAVTPQASVPTMGILDPEGQCCGVRP